MIKVVQWIWCILVVLFVAIPMGVWIFFSGYEKYPDGFTTVKRLIYRMTGIQLT